MRSISTRLVAHGGSSQRPEASFLDFQGYAFSTVPNIHARGRALPKFSPEGGDIFVETNRKEFLERVKENRRRRQM